MKGMKMDWKTEFISLVRSIGAKTYGKERWFYEGDGWYDRETGKTITIDELHQQMLDAIGGTEND